MISKDKKRVCITISKESYDIICDLIGCTLYVNGYNVCVASKSEVIDALVKAAEIN